MKFDWTIGLLALLVYHVFRILCLVFSAWYICHQFNLELFYWVRSFKPWKSQTGSSPQWDKLSALNIRSFKYNYISATASKSQFSWSLGKSVTNTASRAKLCAIWTSYDWWILFIYLPPTVLLSKKEDTLKKNCSARHLSLFSSSSLGLTFASCSIALRLVSFLIRSIPWWKNSQLFPNAFHAIECVEQGGSLGKRGNRLDNSDPDSSGLVKAPQTATLGVWEEWFRCCVCVCLKSFKCLAIQPLITCVVDSIVYLLYTSTCDSVNDRYHLQGLCNTPKKVEATVVWIVWNTG